MACKSYRRIAEFYIQKHVFIIVLVLVIDKKTVIHAVTVKKKYCYIFCNTLAVFFPPYFVYSSPLLEEKVIEYNIYSI